MWDYTREQRFHAGGELCVTAAINGLGRAHVDLHVVVRGKKKKLILAMWNIRTILATVWSERYEERGGHPR